MAPKRRRQDDPPPPSPPPAGDVFSAYFNDAKADILLRSVDGLLFATKKTYLVAVSSVFEEMFGIPWQIKEEHSVRKEGQVAEEALPVVEMAEKGKDLEIYLRWIHRQTFDEIYDQIDDIKILRDATVYLLPLLSLAKKFESPAVFTPAFRLIERFESAHAPNVLAFAVAFKRRKLVQSSLLAWISDLEKEDPADSRDPAYSRYNIRQRKLFAGSQSWSCSDIVPSLFALLPLGFAFHLAAAEKEMLCSVEFDAEEVVEDFMDAFENDFPLE